MNKMIGNSNGPISNLDMIKNHYLSNTLDDMSDALKEVLKRLETANNKLRQGTDNTRQIAKFISAQHSVTVRQAYNDIIDCKALFAINGKADAEYWRNVQIEWYRKQAMLLLNNGNAAEARRYMENHDRLLGLYEKVEAGIDPAIFKPPVIVISTDTKVLDIEYEEITKDEITAYLKKYDDGEAVRKSNLIVKRDDEGAE